MRDKDAEDHDHGLAFDLAILSRRRALALFGGSAVAMLVGCSSDNGTTAAGGDCTTIPEGTSGPFPADGSNGLNVLGEEGIVRSDIRSSFGSSTTTAAGVPLTINVDLVDSGGSCAALAGAAVYLWHCDMNGAYSLYSEGVTAENYLRGVQEANTNGRVSFITIFPAAYAGRWPHIHFEVYESLDAASGGGARIATSQIALPEDACNDVYATTGYEQSVQNLQETSLSSGNVFSDDGGAFQLATVSGSVESGFTVQLTVPVNTG